MKRFNVTVNGKAYDVAVEEVTETSFGADVTGFLVTPVWL